ncbi:MAG: hypothetical protein IKP91_02300 [Bacteroidaceae bacterium]|nr:hypothetical protein [Bacteroidaceae bacterium]
MFDVAYSNNLYATGSAAAAGTKPTITLTLKAANAASFKDAEAGDQVEKYFVIAQASAVSIYAEAPVIKTREYNGKPFTMADLVLKNVPEGHTVTGIEATFTGLDDFEQEVAPGFVGDYTYTIAGDDIKIFLGDQKVNDCFESVGIRQTDTQMHIIAKPIVITAKDQTIYNGQDIDKGTSQVEIATLAEGDMLSEITLEATSLDYSATDRSIKAKDAKILYAKDATEPVDVTSNYDITYSDGKLTILKDVVLITITGHTGTFDYDGEEHTVSGYDCTITYQSDVAPEDQHLTPADIKYNGNPVANLINVGTKTMELTPDKFSAPEGYEAYFVVTDGFVTINPAKVTVAIVGAKKSLAYNGDEQEVSGYTATADNAIYDVNSYIDYIGEGYEPTVAATHAGKYWMEISAEDFENNNENFEVYFMVPDDGDGYLEILPINAKVTIKGKTKTAVYDGEEKTVTGWKATANTDLYHVDTDFAYYGLVDEAGNAYATLTHVLVDDEGEVIKEYMGLDAAYFANVNPDFATVEFVVTDGWLEITKRPVTITITGETAKYEYDAVEHVIEGAVIDISDELYEEEYADAEEIFYAPKEGSASETATAKRTEIGITYMGMKVEDWENFNTDYDVTFEVTDGSVTISYHVASLADDTDNTSTIADIVADYKGMADVTLADRTLYKDGSWNTICLPFDVDIEDSPLAGADVRQLTGASYEEGTLTLEFTAVTEIKAGEPYIIKWEEGNDLVNPVFKGVEVVGPGLSEARFDIGEEMALSFKGTYAPVKYTSENKSILLVGDNSALYYPQAGAFTNPQRAFFELEGIEVGDVESNAIGLRLDGATRINMQTTASDAVYYDLSGRRVVEPTTGIYIVNGKKVIVK